MENKSYIYVQYARVHSHIARHMHVRYKYSESLHTLITYRSLDDTEKLRKKYIEAKRSYEEKVIVFGTTHVQK